MDLNDKNLLVKALLITVFSAAVTAMLSSDEWKKVFKTFIAGIFASVVVYIILTSAGVGELWVLAACCVMSAFVSSLWPVMGEAAQKYLRRKTEKDL